MPIDITIDKLWIRDTLEHWQGRGWTTQGFGMIRCYLDTNKRYRLNVWDDRLKLTPPASTIHDHPWDFTSYIIAGAIQNTVYHVDEGIVGDWTHEYHRIKTGEGGGPVEAPLPARLRLARSELYLPGESYYQPKEWVHDTGYDRGTVTVNDRSAPTQEHTARVFWPAGQRWMDAMPRLATDAEIERSIASALEII